MKKVSKYKLKYTTTMTQKGQITLPKQLRELIGVKPYEKVEFDVRGKEVVLRRAKSILDFAGIFPAVPGKSWKTGREAMEREYERF